MSIVTTWQASAGLVLRSLGPRLQHFGSDRCSPPPRKPPTEKALVSLEARVLDALRRKLNFHSVGAEWRCVPWLGLFLPPSRPSPPMFVRGEPVLSGGN